MHFSFHIYDYRYEIVLDCVPWRVMRNVKNKMAIGFWFYKAQTAAVIIVCDHTLCKEDK